TPLNAILGFSELLRDDLAGKISEKQRRDCLDNIYNSGRHLLSLINDVLDLTKVEAGRMDLVYEEFGVDSAVREVLNVVRSLAMNKDIEIISSVEPLDALLIADKETVFTVDFPPRPGPSKRNRVLVVEDNPSNLDLARMVLEGNGFSVDTASNGQEGLEKARHLRPDLILMDMQLPGVDGLAVT